ncbi:MAG TPA: hypothetical protein PLB78_11130 [Anaerolineae bacterium]|nr:hypothetical protein [Anaerolineae bacterium]
MPQFVVYAPVSGYITGLDSYCSGGTHPKVRSSDCCPTDISANANAEVRLYASSSVKSVGLEFISYVCAVDPSPWTDGIIAHMYDLNGFEIGSVVYGHLTNRGIDGHYNGQVITYNGGYIRVGQVPGLCTDCHHCSKCSTNWELCASCPYWSGGSGDPKS